jgi:polyvinyl alcohol dehydrogenase (cytochrome)
VSAAVTATPELVFSGGLDGSIRAYDVETGEILWQANTAVPFDATNGVDGHGGAIDVAGPVMADGWLYVLSGYSMFGQLPGNMLLAYRISTGQ